MRKIAFLLCSLLWFAAAHAQTIIGTLPFTLQNGTIADANQVMSDFNTIVASVNANAAAAGANTNITALNGLTTPLVYTSGGTSQYIGGTSSGSANAQVVASPIPSGFNLIAGKCVAFIAGFTNTIAMSLNANNTGFINIFRQSTSGPIAMSGGEVVAGNLVNACYDGTQYQIQGPPLQSAVQPCTVIDWVGANGAPPGYIHMDGSAISRTTFATLFSCIAVQGVAATTVNTSPTITVPNSNLFQIGWFVGGNNVTCNSTILGVPDGTHITISNNAGAGGATTLTIGPYAQGDCSTNFNVGNFQGRAAMMRDSGAGVLTTTTCSLPSTLGTNCGLQTHTLTIGEMPAHNHSITDPGHNHQTSAFGSGGTSGNALSFLQSSSAGAGALSTSTNVTNITINNNGGGGAHSILNPVALVDKYIKF